MKKPPLVSLPSACPSEGGSASVPCRLVLPITLLLSLGGCTSFTAPPRSEPTPFFVAYWSADPGSPACPSGARCVDYAWSRDDLDRLIETKRNQDPPLEIVDFDARISQLRALYAGVWARSDAEHEIEPELTWSEFFDAHRRLSEQGRRLISLEVYDSRDVQRVAAIWRPGTSESSSGPERVTHDRDWKWLKKTEPAMRREGYFLAEIEAYPGPGGIDDRFAAGVWRAGEMETRLLTGLQCESRPERLDPETTLGTRDASPVDRRCGLIRTLEEMNAKGFQVVDLESYRSQDGENWAVLLHRRTGDDWLLLPGSRKGINDRYSSLDSSSTRDPEPDRDMNGDQETFRLLDLDLLSIQDAADFPSHQGVVHDGGTSGPPP